MVLSQSVSKYGCHRQFLFPVVQFLKKGRNAKLLIVMQRSFKIELIPTYNTAVPVN
jgi:hypothetical protein